MTPYRYTSHHTAPTSLRHFEIRTGMGRLEVGLHQSGCVTERIVVHELLHVLGFRHEHNRPDRDDHIIMHWNNIRVY